MSQMNHSAVLIKTLYVGNISTTQGSSFVAWPTHPLVAQVLLNSFAILMWGGGVYSHDWVESWGTKRFLIPRGKLWQRGCLALFKWQTPKLLGNPCPTGFWWAVPGHAGGLGFPMGPFWWRVHPQPVLQIQHLQGKVVWDTGVLPMK